MSLSALITLRDRLVGHPGLQAYWLAHYGRDARQLIGYKRAPSAHDYPSLCYVPVAAQLHAKKPDEIIVGVVAGVHEAGETAAIMDGVTVLSDVQTLIRQALTPLALADGWEVNGVRPIGVETDLGVRHPFYELEMHIPLIKRK